jgi:hypothetical protein
VPAEHSWVGRDLAPNAVDENEMNQRLHSERESNGGVEPGTGRYIDCDRGNGRRKPTIERFTF